MIGVLRDLQYAGGLVALADGLQNGASPSGLVLEPDNLLRPSIMLQWQHIQVQFAACIMCLEYKHSEHAEQATCEQQ